MNGFDPQRTRAGWSFFLLVLGLFLLPAVGADEAWALDAESYVDAELSRGEGGFFRQPRWSPYVVGTGIGLLSWLAFLLSDHPLGVSTAYARSAGMIEKAVRGARVGQKAYYREFEPKVDWEWMFVVGLLIGAAVSAVTAGDVRIEFVPPLWEAAFGPAPIPRILAAVLGGWLIGLGARWAGGCTSGHGISGTLQLVLSSWVAVICFFIGGVAAAMVIFRVLA